MNGRASGLRDAWKRTLREDGARLLCLVFSLNGNDNRTQMAEHWKRLTPGLKGIEWRLPTWPNVFPSNMVRGQGEPDKRTLLELMQSEQEHLIRFMDSWFAAGRDYGQWVKENPELVAILNDSSQFIRVHIQPLPGGGLQPVTTVEPPVQERTLYGAAASFIDYLRNPLRGVLAGRCKRCHRYFINRKGYEQMVYCGQKCRWDAHNAEKVQSREGLQQKMETTALTAMRQLFDSLNTGGKLAGKSWKHRIVAVVNKKHGAHYEPKWLTRTINDADGKNHRQFTRVRDGIERRLAAIEL
jgi:hypothetical protein